MAAHIGALRRVVVRQLKPQVGGGWFLDRVLVTGPGGQQWVFPCSAWLGLSDSSDRIGACKAGDFPTSYQELSVLMRPLNSAGKIRLFCAVQSVQSSVGINSVLSAHPCTLHSVPRSVCGHSVLKSVPCAVCSVHTLARPPYAQLADNIYIKIMASNWR